MATPIQGEAQYIDALSRLTLRPLAATEVFPRLASLTDQQKKDFTDLADSNHVTIRAFEVINRVAGNCGHPEIQAWAMDVLMQERSRIDQALTYLQQVCDELEANGCPALVMKSLDHWPDLGNDLDLLSTGERKVILHVFRNKFHARVEPQSWGDRLANKWNFILPELPELVEIHMRRLGQTGEQVTIANSLISRARSIKIGNYAFRVSAPEHRLMICTLQRMYRHFYARLCDFVNTETLLQTETVDYELLRSASQAAGIWEGVATFLAIVSDYIECYRGQALGLPAWVTKAARFRGDQISFAKGFLRVRILPHSATLYASELTKLLRRGELKSSIRLTLLPCLATAAAVGQKITGSDKGIW